MGSTPSTGRPSEAPDDDEGLYWPEQAADEARTGLRTQHDGDGASNEDEADEESPLAEVSSFALITYGALIGAFAVFALSWLSIAWPYFSNPPQPLFDPVDRAQLALSVSAPVLWLVFGLVTVRGRRWPWQLAWVLVGLIALAPWPLVINQLIPSILEGAA